jgi:glutamate synthase domain-containing protein 1
MCGIVGFLDRRPEAQRRPLGATMLRLLEALACRGPDSSGVALYGPSHPSLVSWIKLPEGAAPADAAEVLRDVLQETLPVARQDTVGAYLRVELAPGVEVPALEAQLRAHAPGAEIVSCGHQLEIIKQVGSPAQLEAAYGISRKTGSHAIGHTRLSTESRVDLSHSQPFWAHGVPDLATVHNGHITNYHKLRRQYEQRGHRFYTENDSEILGVYLRDRLAAGLSLADALRSSLDDLDGSFCYLVATATQFGYVKDRFGFKPLVVAETDAWVAIATEEIALRHALEPGFLAREPAPGRVALWTVPGREPAVLESP